MATAKEPAWAKQVPAYYMLDRHGNSIPSSDTRQKQEIRSLFDRAQVANGPSNLTGPQFRLLQIRPGSLNMPICGDLISRPIFDAPSYKALSYSWGPAVYSKEILMGQTNVSFPVSAHLWNALKRLRNPRRTVYVWVDAICINQESLVDKTAQIHVMAQIYNAADEVVIWLGNLHSYDSGPDLEFFWVLCHLDQPWWKRLWVLQECAYASECPTVMIGHSSTTLEEFEQRWTKAAELCTSDDQRKLLLENLDFLRMPYQAWIDQAAKNSHRKSLLQRLHETVGRQYSVPHDRIYALLSLITEEEAQNFPPDYGTSLTDLHTEVERVIGRSLQSEKGPHLDLLQVTHMSYLASNIINAARRKDVANAQSFIRANVAIPHALDVVMERAMAQGDHDVVELLLDNGMEVHIQDEPYSRLLHLLLINGHERSATELMEAGIENQNPGHYYYNALYAASRRGHLEVVQRLLEAGVDVNFGSSLLKYGNALCAASVGCHREVVELLLDAGADVNAQAGYDGNALQAALVGGDEEIVKRLLGAGADANAQGGYHGNALQTACASGSNVRVVRLLIDAGADVNAKGGTYGTALQLACASKSHDDGIVELLLRAGADANAGESYSSALQSALKKGDQKVIALLLDAGAKAMPREAEVARDLAMLGFREFLNTSSDRVLGKNARSC